MPPHLSPHRLSDSLADKGGGAGKGLVIVAAERHGALRQQLVDLAVGQFGIPRAHLAVRRGMTAADLPGCPAVKRKIFRLTRRANQWLKPAHLTR